MKVTPRASKDSIGPGDADRLAVRLRAPPVDGAANAALIEFLARHFDLPRRGVSILSGENARLKRVRLSGDPAHLASLLETL
ncbi:DUF167 domain-containing protein [Sphingomonas colocasiae]|uniref:UPF0235 protein K7G82_21175 n=1 Tax=Sphingomonas colocasiae TaxID=1848973 RepID=A0ABS7PU05_9SPHN|nr:DUF167 domain-containing protein [Sphingomonas colocasiae]